MTAAPRSRLRSRLAAKAFAHTARYDTMVASYLARAPRRSPAERFPTTLPLVFDKVQDLRYGENPHQQAAFYRDTGAARRKRLHGDACCRARICRSTTSPTRTPPSSACASSTSPPA